MDHNTFMRAAIALSKRNFIDGGTGTPFGAVVVHNGEVVGEGSNQVAASNDPTAHAEVVAIRQACTKLGTSCLKGCTIYTSCEPCSMCLSAILWARLDRIYYGNTLVDAEMFDFLKPISARVISTEQLLHEEAIEVFQAWKASRIKVP